MADEIDHEASGDAADAVNAAMAAIEPTAEQLASYSADAFNPALVYGLSAAISLKRIADALGSDLTDAAFDLGRAFAKGMEQGRREADPLVSCTNCGMVFNR